MRKYLPYDCDWKGLCRITLTCSSRYLQCSNQLNMLARNWLVLWVHLPQVEIGKRERMLASAEIEGLKKYHFKETHELQDQLLAQRSIVSKLTLRLQEAMQVTLICCCKPSNIHQTDGIVCVALCRVDKESFYTLNLPSGANWLCSFNVKHSFTCPL